MPKPVRIVCAEPVSPIIAMSPVLCLAAFGFELACVRTKAEITSVDINDFAGQNGRYLPTAVTICAVEPVVQTIIKAVGTMLRIAWMKAGEQNFFHIRSAVAVGVFGVEQIRRSQNK